MRREVDFEGILDRKRLDKLDLIWVPDIVDEYAEWARSKQVCDSQREKVLKTRSHLGGAKTRTFQSPLLRTVLHLDCRFQLARGAVLAVLRSFPWAPIRVHMRPFQPTFQRGLLRGERSSDVYIAVFNDIGRVLTMMRTV